MLPRSRAGTAIRPRLQVKCSGGMLFEALPRRKKNNVCTTDGARLAGEALRPGPLFA